MNISLNANANGIGTAPISGANMAGVGFSPLRESAQAPVSTTPESTISTSTWLYQ